MPDHRPPTDLTDDERFADQRSRALNHHELTEELESALAAKTTAGLTSDRFGASFLGVPSVAEASVVTWLCSSMHGFL